MTLLEVLLALAIFATASIAVIQSVSQHISSLAHVKEKTFAAMVADNELALTVLNPKLIRNHTGQMTFANRLWYWKIHLVATTSSSQLQAYDVTVSVERDSSPIVSVRNYVQKSQLQ